MKQRVADYLFSTIADLGVKDVFLLPGGGAMHLVDALGQNSDLRFIPVHHEQAAAIAAEAYARVNEKIGVALVTTGPGALNTLTAVAGAWIESVPLLIISGQVKRADMKGDSGVRQMGPQEVDIVSMVKPITKYAVTIENPEDIHLHLENAIALATTGRQGPVWLDVPLDIQAAMIDTDSFADKAPVLQQNENWDQQCINDIADLIKQAKRPLILAGHGIRLSGAAKAFSTLVEALQIPVVTTWNAMDLLAYDHMLYVGKPGSVALRAANFAVQNCDLLISMGARLDNVITAHNPKGFAASAKKIVVDIDQAEMRKHQMAIDIAVIADANEFIQAVIKHDIQSDTVATTQWRQQCQQWKQKYGICDGQAFPQTGEISHYHFIDELSNQLKEGELIITGSSGMAVEVFYLGFRTRKDQRVFLTSGLGSMGYGLPAAIGGCLAAGGKPVVSIEGDGSLQLNLQELSTLKALNLPVRMFVMNNSGYASIRNTQRNYFDGRYVATGEESGLLMPDIIKVAQAIGLDTLIIDDARDLDKKIRLALAHTGPLICDVRLVSDEALWPKVAAMPQKDGSIISMPLEDMSPLLPLEQLQSEMYRTLSTQSLQARSVG